jgi:hypothetical protein
MTLLDDARQVMRVQHLSTEKTYLPWIEETSAFAPSGWCHPKDLRAPEVEAFFMTRRCRG